MKLLFLGLYSFTLLICLPLDIRAQGLFNGNGSYLVADGSIAIVLENGGLKNDGMFIKGNSTVYLSGNTPTSASAISGTGSLDFYHLTMNKSANGIQLNRSITVSGILNFQNGDSIFLNNNNVDLGTTGTISGERADSRFTGLTGGYVMITQTLNAPTLANPGNIGIAITSSSNLGSTVIKRSHAIFRNLSIKRSFEIIPTTNTGLDASFNFYYFLPELNGISEAALSTYSSVNSGSNWSYATNILPNSTMHYITSNSINSFSMLTLFTTGIALPVELLYLKGRAADQHVLLTWATASETDNDRFEVERSLNGIQFTTIGSLKGARYSSVQQTYQFTDSFPVHGINYYRLKQLDLNQKTTYSATIAVQSNHQNATSIRLSPNPVNTSVELEFYAEEAEQLRVQLIDVNGRIQKTFQLNSRIGYNQATFDLTTLPKGMYTLKAVGKTNFSIQLLKL